MKIIVKDRFDSIAHFGLQGNLDHASILRKIRQAAYDQAVVGKSGAVIDLSEVKRVTSTGVAALVELLTNTWDFHFALANPTRRFKDAVQKVHANDLLPTYDDCESAVRGKELKFHRLRNHKAVVLVAGKGTRMQPLTQNCPKPMLDIFGKPILWHILRSLKASGVAEVALNPGYMGNDIIDYFSQHKIPGQSLLFSNEMEKKNLEWLGRPTGSASTLLRLHQQNAFFDDDFFVLCGDALVDIDFSEMMYHHKKSNAMMTIATQIVPNDSKHKYGIVGTNEKGRILQFFEKPNPEDTPSNLANTGIYIFSPAILDSISYKFGLDIGTNLIPKLMSYGVTIESYESNFKWIDIGDPKSYFNALKYFLSLNSTNLINSAIEQHPNVWIERDSKISRSAKVLGPVYIGSNVKIQSNANIIGPTYISSNIRIADNAYIKNSIILKNTDVSKGSFLNRKIVGPSFCLDHEYPKKSPTLPYPKSDVLDVA